MNPDPSSAVPMISVSLPRVGTSRRRVRPTPRSRRRRAPTCSRHPRPGAATCHPKRFKRSKGNRRPGCMLRTHDPSQSSGSPMVPPLSSAPCLEVGSSILARPRPAKDGQPYQQIASQQFTMPAVPPSWPPATGTKKPATLVTGR